MQRWHTLHSEHGKKQVPLETNVKNGKKQVLLETNVKNGKKQVPLETNVKNGKKQVLLETNVKTPKKCSHATESEARVMFDVKHSGLRLSLAVTSVEIADSLIDDTFEHAGVCTYKRNT